MTGAPHDLEINPTLAMATVTKRDIINHVTDKLENPTQMLVTDVVQTTIDCITTALARGDKVALRKFGTFEVRYTPPKIGRNPKDAVLPVPIPARAIVRFKPSQELKDKAAQVLPKLLAKRGE